MKYIKSYTLDKLSDNEIIYVNRNILNVTLTKYEMSEDKNYTDELLLLLSLWEKTYKIEKETQRIETFIKIKNHDAKKCFKNYKNLPFGSFCIINE